MTHHSKDCICHLCLPGKGRTAPIMTLQSRFFFGKHGGKTLEQICREDPQYILWALENVKGFYVNEEVMKLAREHL